VETSIQLLYFAKNLGAAAKLRKKQADDHPKGIRPPMSRRTSLDDAMLRLSDNCAERRGGKALERPLPDDALNVIAVRIRLLRDCRGRVQTSYPSALSLMRLFSR
jgi:hypothetical protein